MFLLYNTYWCTMDTFLIYILSWYLYRGIDFEKDNHRVRTGHARLMFRAVAGQSTTVLETYTCKMQPVWESYIHDIICIIVWLIHWCKSWLLCPCPSIFQYVIVLHSTRKIITYQCVLANLLTFISSASSSSSSDASDSLLCIISSETSTRGSNW